MRVAVSPSRTPRPEAASPRTRAWLRVLLRAVGLGAFIALVIAIAGPPATAETAYIAQVEAGAPRSSANVAPLAAGPASTALPLAGSAMSAILPESLATAPGRNVAHTFQSGAYNTVVQAQSGSDNESRVGIVAGRGNTVGVMQAGEGLRSDVMLVGTRGLNVTVLQPKNSAPVNLFVAPIKGGGLMIKR
jgi:hypothetical protein